MRGKRIWCEDISPTLKSIRASKKHGKTVEIQGLQYEYVGDDMLFCLKTFRIKKLLLLLLLISNLSFGQERKYSFEYRENRTPTGLQKVQTPGDVIIYEGKYSHTVTIITENRFEHLYVKSRQLFIRQDTLLYTLVDEYYNECSLRVVVKESLDNLELYYYSDRIEDKYYRLILKKCK